MTEMTLRERADEQTRIRRELLAKGYSPLANVDKTCVLPRWSRLKIDDEKIEEWSDQLAYLATGVRVEGQILVMDMDIDDSGILDEIWARLPDDLLDRLDAAPMRFGRGAKFAVFLRLREGETKVGRQISQGYAPPDRPGKVMRAEAFDSGKARQMGAYGPHSHNKDGSVAVEYRWAADVGDLTVTGPDELPEVTRAEVELILDTSSSVMLESGWTYEVKTASGAVDDGPIFDISDDMRFVTAYHGEMGLEDLEALCEASPYEGVRLSASWLEGSSAQNTERCIARLNPMDGRLQIWESAAGVIHRPIEVDVNGKAERLGERLSRVGVSGGAGESGGESGSGGQSKMARLLAASPPEKRVFSSPEGEAAKKGKEVIHILSGAMHETANETMVKLRESHDRLFDMGGMPVVVDEDGKVRAAHSNRLAHEMQRVIDFVEVQETAKGSRARAVDPPKDLIGRVEALSHELPALRAVVDMPTMRRDGALIGQGYDAGSALLVLGGADVAEAMPDSIGDDEAREALSALWKPFSEFPFAGPLDRGGALAAVLTAVLRSVLPTAPMFVFDAPTQGSGKTLMSLAVGEIVGGAQLMAPLPSKDEAEVRKILMSVLLEAPRAVVFDNQWGMLDSAVLAGMLTSEVFGGRLLGTNTNLKAPTSVLVMVTGNNVILGGETPRRSVRVRIDAGMDTPFTRRFDFCPQRYVRENREQIVLAALMLIRWALGRASRGRVGSFEVWDEMVGQTVALVGKTLDAGFGDPAESIQAAHADDPRRDELGEILRSFRDEFGNKWFSGADVVARLAGHSGASASPLMDALGTDRVPSSKTVGKLLSYRRDAVVDGMRLQIGRDPRTKTNRFRVWADTDSEGVVAEGELEKRRAEQMSKVKAVQPRT